MNQQSPRDWVAIRAAYADHGRTIADICRAFAVARSTLQARAHREAWPPRLHKPAAKPKRSARARQPAQRTKTTRRTKTPSRAKRDAADTVKQSAQAATPTAPETREAAPPAAADRAAPRRRAPKSRIRTRLMEVIAMQLERLEQRIAEPSDMTSADCEREARALNSLVRNVETLEADKGPAPKTRRAAASARNVTSEIKPEDVDEQDVFRRDVAARNLRLRERLDGQSG
ncbi:MAG: hypothetical protein AAGG99_04825 [Pseudomonadota bacterium]